MTKLSNFKAIYTVIASSFKFFIETNSCCLAMDHNDSVKRKCLFKIQLRTTFCWYSRKHAYAKFLYHMYWSIFQHIKTAGWTKENYVEIPSCTKRHSNGHSFNWYCIKVKDIWCLFNQFILKIMIQVWVKSLQKTLKICRFCDF